MSVLNTQAHVAISSTPAAFDAESASGAVLTVPVNSQITVDTSSDKVKDEASNKKPSRNVAYKTVIVEQTKDAKKGIRYESVNLKPALYKPNQTFESVQVVDEILTPLTRKEYVSQYRTAEVKTAKTTLDMCRVVYEANQTLNSAEFNDFCNDIGYKDYSSVVRKFIVIGKLQPRLSKHAEALPASWSAIYALTQIPAQAFENLVEMNRSFKEMSVSKINELVKQTRDLNKIDDIVSPGLMTLDEKNQAILKGTVLAKVYFSKIPDDLDWQAFEKALLAVEANLPIRIQFLNEAKEVFRLRKNKRYESIKDAQAPLVFQPETWDMGKKVEQMNNTTLEQSSK